MYDKLFWCGNNKNYSSSQRITFSHTTWFGSHLETRGNNQETILSSQRIVKQRFREEKQIYESNFSKRKTIVSREKHSVFKTEATIFQDKKKKKSEIFKTGKRSSKYKNNNSDLYI